MGGEGSMSSANLSLKQNRGFLKRNSFKGGTDLYLQNSGNTKLEFKKVSPEELELIKEKIRKQHKENTKKEIIVFVVTIFLTIAIVYYLIVSL